MGNIEDARDWIANEASTEQRAAVAARLAPEGGLLNAINAVGITGPQLRAAIDAISHVQVRTQTDAVEHARILAGFVREYGFDSPYAAPALQMRAVAADRWCRAHDPRGETNPDVFFEAAARHALVQTDRGPAFEPQSFAELVEFMGEMPF